MTSLHIVCVYCIYIDIQYILHCMDKIASSKDTTLMPHNINIFRKNLIHI